MSELTLLYGPTNSGKTTTCGLFHEYEATRNQVPGYHVTIDSSIDPMSDQIRSGMVKVWHLGYEGPQTQSNLLTALHALAKGYLPVDLDPVTGQRLSNRWHAPTCSVSVEGLFMLSQALVQYFAIERGLTNAAFTELSGQQVGGAQMQVYSLVKTQMTDILSRMKGLPNIRRIIWTSHDGVGTDSMQCTILGPAMVPSKGLDKLPPLFAHCLHVQNVTIKNEQAQDEEAKLYYFDPHKQEHTGLPWPSKTSLSPMQVYRLREYAKSQSGGAVSNALLARIVQGQVVGGFLDFLRFLDWSNKVTIDVQPQLTQATPNRIG